MSSKTKQKRTARSIVPESAANPLTNYRITSQNGTQKMELPLRDVIRMREYEMENKL